MEQQEYLLKLSMIQQESTQLEEKMRLIEQQAEEMQAIKTSLEEIEKDGKESMLANLGKGIFIKTDIKEKELFVNIGKEIFLKKNIKDTIKILEEQITELTKGKEKIIERILEVQEETEKVIALAKKEQKNLEKKI